jgi:hypothetical protein
MTIAFECDGESVNGVVECVVAFKSNYDQDFMGITSNLLLNNLLVVEIEDFSGTTSQNTPAPSLDVKKFNLKVFKSK